MDVLRRASPATLAALTPAASLTRLAKGEHLFWDKEEVARVYFVVEGGLSLYKLHGAGEKKVIFVHGPGQMINEEVVQDLPSSINCEALSDARVLWFSKKPFLEAMAGDFRLAKAVMDSMSAKIRRLYRQLKNTTGSVRGDKKIVAKLWKLSKDYGSPCAEGIRIDLDLTVTHLAEILGAQRETVSRQMKILLDKGLVIRQKNSFIIPDRDRLMKYFKEA